MMARRLLNAGAKLNEENQAGDTILHVAARRATPEMIKMFVKKGADPNKVHFFRFVFFITLC
jgi:ankyrin repeat protein